MNTSFTNAAPLHGHGFWRRKNRMYAWLCIFIMLVIALQPSISGAASSSHILSPENWTIEYHVKVGNEIFQVVRLKNPESIPVQLVSYPLLILQNGQLPRAGAPLSKVGLVVQAREQYKDPEFSLSNAQLLFDSYWKLFTSEVLLTGVGGLVMSIPLVGADYGTKGKSNLTSSFAKNLAKEFVASPRNFLAVMALVPLSNSISEYQQAALLWPRLQAPIIDSDDAAEYLRHYLNGENWNRLGQGWQSIAWPKLTMGAFFDNVKSTLKGGAKSFIEEKLTKDLDTALLDRKEDNVLQKLKTGLRLMKYSEYLDTAHSWLSHAFPAYDSVLNGYNRWEAHHQKILSGEAPTASVRNTQALATYLAGTNGSSVKAPTLGAEPRCSGSSPSISLSWTAVTGATNYEIFRDGNLIHTTRTAETTYMDVVTLDPGRSYTYTVASINGGTRGAMSSPVGAIAPTTCSRVTPPTSTSGSTSGSTGASSAGVSKRRPETPTLRSATARCDGSESGIDLAWSTVSGAVRYRIYRDGTLIYTTGTDGGTFWNAIGLTAGRSYAYQVQAEGSDGVTGEMSNALSQTAPNCNTSSSAFRTGDLIRVFAWTVNLRDCAGLKCTVLTEMSKGLKMTVVGGPTTRDGYVWWQLSGRINGKPYTGWAVEKYLEKD